MQVILIEDISNAKTLAMSGGLTLDYNFQQNKMKIAW